MALFGNGDVSPAVTAGYDRGPERAKRDANRRLILPVLA